MADTSFARAASHDAVRYSQVWEDHGLVSLALVPAPGDTVVSLASAGCNALALLLAGEGPDAVLAVDVSPAQTALFELKIAALRSLPDIGAVARFVGAREVEGDRVAVYSELRGSLSPEARAYWDVRPEVIEGGVIGCGMLDRYIAGFARRYVEPLVSSEAIASFLHAPDVESQTLVFRTSLTAIEPAVREWYGRAGLQGRARDESQFAHVGAVDVAGAFWQRFVDVCTTVPARGNFYLEYLLTAGYADLDHGPPWLRPANFDTLRARLDRVRVIRAELGAFVESLAPESLAGANLSDVFEYLSPDATRALLASLATRLRPGGRIAYWNLFVDRSTSAEDGFEPVSDLGEELFAGDRVPFYGAFRVDERVALS
jgi:S-adenosylmethionine-diacylglycerol 3-amino-3-carboxypropyl transferase